MLLDIIKKGSADKSVELRIIDSTDGTPETAVVFNTSGIDLWYRRQGEAKTSITEATLAALTTAHADGGFLHISDGYYRLDLPDAAFATGAEWVAVGGTVTGMVVIGGRVRLVDFDTNDAVRLGLTALPNANAEAAGGLYTRGTGAGQINQANNGNIDANTVRLAGTALTARDIGASVLISSGTGTGQLDVTAGVVKANLAQILGTALTETAGQIAGGFKKVFDVSSPVFTAQSVNQTGDSFVRLGAPAGASVSVDVAAIKTDTGNLVTRITSTLFSGITSLKEWLGLLAGKQAGNSTARTELRSSGAGSGTFDETTDSVEAIRDRGDVAWITGAGGDPWATSVPGAYGAGTAGNILGNRLDAAVSTRATPANVQSELGTYGALKPTTAGRTLDVTATGEAGIDLDNTAGTLAKGTDLTGFNDLSAANVQSELTTYGALKPTTAGRTLDVSTGGEAGVDWANVGSPTTSQTLSGTTIGTATNLTNDPPGVTTLLGRITSTLFTGITSLAQWLGAVAGKQTANSTARTEIRATGGGSGTFDETTDSNEALRDNMGTPQTGDSFTRIGAAGAGLTALGDTRIANLDATTFSRATPAQVQTELGTYGALKPTVAARTLDVSATGEAGVDWANVGSPGTAQSLSSTTVGSTTTIGSAGVDAVWAKTMTELSGVPGVNAAVLDALRWCFLASRNKITQTATAQTLRNDADSSNVAASTVSDDGTTFTRGKFA